MKTRSIWRRTAQAANIKMRPKEMWVANSTGRILVLGIGVGTTTISVLGGLALVIRSLKNIDFSMSLSLNRTDNAPEVRTD